LAVEPAGVGRGVAVGPQPGALVRGVGQAEPQVTLGRLARPSCRACEVVGVREAGEAAAAAGGIGGGLGLGEAPFDQGEEAARVAELRAVRKPVAVGVRLARVGAVGRNLREVA